MVSTFKDEYEVILGLESVVEVQNEGVLGYLEYVPFVLDNRLSITIYYGLFLHQFHGVELVVEVGLHQKNIAESSRT